MRRITSFSGELLKFGSGVILDEPLIEYRIHPGSISVQSRKQQIQEHLQISAELISEKFPELAECQGSINKIVSASLGPEEISFRDILAGIESVYRMLALFFEKETSHICTSKKLRLICWTSAKMLKAFVVGGGLKWQPVKLLALFLCRPQIFLFAGGELIYRYVLGTAR